MLRRKLMLILGAVVLLLVAMAAGSLALLQDVLERQDHLTNEALAGIDHANAVNTDLARIQVELYQLQLHSKHRLDSLIDAVETLHRTIALLGEHHEIRETPTDTEFADLSAIFTRFERSVGALATARDPELALLHNQEAITQTIAMQRLGMAISADLRDHAGADHHALTRRFRWTVIGLTVVFLLVINVSIVVLVQIGRMVVEPVEQLVDASRALGRGQFDTRVDLAQHDEFDELAQAFNQLAQELQATDERRLEVLRQVGLTLNHELNNAMAIIELQLQLLGKQSGGDPAQAKALQRIHHSLQRMTETVQNLRNVRRIVLMEYASGLQMLNLQESIKEQADTTATE